MRTMSDIRKPARNRTVYNVRGRALCSSQGTQSSKSLLGVLRGVNPWPARKEMIINRKYTHQTARILSPAHSFTHSSSHSSFNSLLFSHSILALKLLPEAFLSSPTTPSQNHKPTESSRSGSGLLTWRSLPNIACRRGPSDK